MTGELVTTQLPSRRASDGLCLTLHRYRPLSKPNTVGTRSKKGGTSTTYEPEVELVTVPAMGAEWTAQELKDMKKSGKAERKREERQREWRAFVRDQKGLCGIPWLTRKVIVWFTFGFLIS